MLLEQDKDTITALSTAPGAGGIAVVRVSGTQALSIVRDLAPFLPETPESHRIYFGTLKEKPSGDALDEVLISYFAKGKSFTGEEVLEISCHGGDWLANQVVRALLDQGARLANRGEFTYRAFMNGRMDLMQAEAVLSLIESRSKASARAALRQLKGAPSKRIDEILNNVTWVAANLEANIDFAQEDIVVAQNDALHTRLSTVTGALSELLKNESQSRLWDEGYHVAILGLPNVGKSSLLNALLNEERAIVTDQPGTTRDLVEGDFDVHGIRVKLTDTAGLRTTEDVVEGQGIERARKVAQQADMILFLFDGQNELATLEELASLSKADRMKTILIRSKADLSAPVGQELLSLQQLAKQKERHELSEWLSEVRDSGVMAVSATQRTGLDLVIQAFTQAVQSQFIEDAPMAIRARHVELLRKAQAAVDRSIKLVDDSASPEFTAFELHEAVLALHEILGRRFDDQVMDRVFNEFCLGK